MAGRTVFVFTLVLCLSSAVQASLEAPVEARPASKVDATAAAAPAANATVGSLFGPAAAAAAAAPAAASADADLDAALARGEAVQVVVSFKDAAVKEAVAAATAAPVAAAATAADTSPAEATRVSALASLKAKALSSAAGAKVEAEFTHMPVSVVTVTSAAALSALRADATVDSVAAVARHTRALVQSMPLVSQPAAASRGATGAGCAVAVLDGGGNYGAADLGSCSAPGAPAPCRVALAQDFTSENSFTTTDAHSTNVASIIAKVAPGATILLLDVFKGQYAYDTDILAAINWVVANKAKYNICSINLSLGDSAKNTQRCATSAYEPAFAAVRAAGIVPAVASGNEYYQNAISGPACAPSAVAVGAVHDSNHGSFDSCDTTTSADKVACFSNVAPWLDILAPGSTITAGGWTMSGTSMASPHVAAAAAILSAAAPAASAVQIIAALKTTGKQVTDWATGLAFPRLDVDAAVTAIGGVKAIGGSVTINGAAPSTASPRVKLSIAPSAGVPTAGLQMCVSNGASCTSFVPFAPALNWVLDFAQSGPKTVSVWLQDAAGTKSQIPASATIAFALGADTAAPSDVSSVAAAVDAGLTSVTLSWDPSTANDDVTGVAKFIVVYKAGAYPPVKCATSKRGVLTAPVAEGGDVATAVVSGLKARRTYRFRVCAVDYAGNVSNGVTGFASMKKRRSSRLMML